MSGLADSGKETNGNPPKGEDKEVILPKATDVLLGRGNGIANFPGNINFRNVIWSFRHEYTRAYRTEKRDVAQKVIDYIETKCNPRGRFIQPDPEKKEGYILVPLQRKLEKTCQALREKKQSPPNPKKVQEAQDQAARASKREGPPTELPPWKKQSASLKKQLDAERKTTPKKKYHSKKVSKKKSSQQGVSPIQVPPKPKPMVVTPYKAVSTKSNTTVKRKKTTSKKRSQPRSRSVPAKKRRVSINSYHGAPLGGTTDFQASTLTLTAASSSTKMTTPSHPFGKHHFVSQEELAPAHETSDGAYTAPLFKDDEDSLEQVLRPRVLFGSPPSFPLGAKEDFMPPTKEDTIQVTNPSGQVLEFFDAPGAATAQVDAASADEEMSTMFEVLPPNLTAFFSGIFSGDQMNSSAKARSKVDETYGTLGENVSTELQPKHLGDPSGANEAQRLYQDSPTTVFHALPQLTLEPSHSILLQGGWDHWKAEDELLDETALETWKDWDKFTALYD